MEQSPFALRSKLTRRSSFRPLSFIMLETLPKDALAHVLGSAVLTRNDLVKAGNVQAPEGGLLGPGAPSVADSARGWLRVVVHWAQAVQGAE